MDMDQLPYGLRCELLDAYGTWVTDYMDQGHDGYLTTFMFNYIPGHPPINYRINDQGYRTVLSDTGDKGRQKCALSANSSTTKAHRIT
jgi:hypothetical protein